MYNIVSVRLFGLFGEGFRRGPSELSPSFCGLVVIVAQCYSILYCGEVITTHTHTHTLYIYISRVCRDAITHIIIINIYRATIIIIAFVIIVYTDIHMYINYSPLTNHPPIPTPTRTCTPLKVVVLSA